MNALWLALLLGLADEVPAERVEAAKTFVELLNKGEFDRASRDFDEAMKKALPEPKLKEAWETVTREAGAFRKVLSTRTERAGKYDVVFVTCDFARGKLDARLVFDKGGKIGGMQIRPSLPKFTFKPPPYSRAEAWIEKEVTVGDGKWKLPGTLTLPKGDGPFAAVVLVHGSGPQDRDETVLANKPLRDLAWGLATKGVAVLRYEKVTRAHPAKLTGLGRYTLDDETTDDAVAAVRLLLKTEKIDPKKVFVLGHSLGAIAAPRIVEREPAAAGAVLMAGTTRPLEDVIVEQYTYLFSLQGEMSAEQKKQLEEVKKSAARVKDPKLKPDAPKDEMPMKVPASYWLSLREYDQKAVAAKLKQPLLVLQAERDYQVTTVEFEGWKKALAGKKNATLKSYPALNHLFMKGEGKSRPEEYLKPGHVEGEVLDDIVAWIRGR